LPKAASMTTEATAQHSGAIRRLLRDLKALLGYDNDDAHIQDILDHVLTIESTDSMLLFFEQFLGAQHTAAAREFVQLVSRYRSGESIETTQEESMIEEPAAVAIASLEKPITTDTPEKKATPDTPQMITVAANTSKPVPLATVAPPVKKLTTTAAAGKKKKTPALVRLEKKQPKAATAATTEKSSPAVPPPSKKGVALVDCGCFGEKHGPFANCLECGRIACLREKNAVGTEGAVYCAYCGTLVEAPSEDTVQYVHALILCAYTVFQLTFSLTEPVGPRGRTRKCCYNTIERRHNAPSLLMIKPIITRISKPRG
jgi:hypothetical protein